MSGAWRTLSAGALAFRTGLGIPFTHTTSCGLWNPQEGSQVGEVNSEMTAASSPLTGLEVTRNAATLFPSVRDSHKVEMAIPWPQRPEGNWLSVSNPILTSFIVQANLIVCARAKSFQWGKSSYKSPDGPAQSRLKSGDFSQFLTIDEQPWLCCFVGYWAGKVEGGFLRIWEVVKTTEGPVGSLKWIQLPKGANVTPLGGLKEPENRRKSRKGGPRLGPCCPEQWFSNLSSRIPCQAPLSYIQ